MSIFSKTLIIILVLAVLGVGGYYGYKYYQNLNTTGKISNSDESGKPVSIPTEILNNKFGFLAGGPDDYKTIIDTGAAWVRPHPGAFLWDSMQKSKLGKINFTETDQEIVQHYGDNNLAVLATLWPFAEWDQLSRTDSIQCAVSDTDEFLAKNDKKGRGGYISAHRCAPTDWVSYAAWVTAVVERYDGDGLEDAPGLKIPVKYWEVMNEPDLPAGPDGRLVFWRDTPSKYAELLIKTSAAIKAADPEAKVVIAGAAGGNDQFLSFFRVVLAQTGAKEAFDIGNIHCISNDSYDSFNVEPYKKLLAELGLNKQIWVTEAESIVSADPSVNATQTKNSTKKALDLGASKIFYTKQDFEAGTGPGNQFNPNQKPVSLVADMDGKEPISAYRAIFKSLQ